MITRARRGRVRANLTRSLLFLLAWSPVHAPEGTAPAVHCHRTGDDVATLTAQLPPGLDEAAVERTHWASKTTGGWSNEHVDGPATTHHARVRPGLEAEGRVRFQTRDGWTGWSGSAGCPAAPPFILEYGNRNIPLANVAPGPFDSDLGSATWAELSRDTSAEFPTACAGAFETWRVVKLSYDGDRSLADFFDAFEAGLDDTGPAENVSLIYLEADNGTEARRINAFGITPLRYGTSGADSQGSGPLVETMEFSVERCEYA